MRAFVGTLIELGKLVREMLVIPTELWLFAAENVGAVVLAGWRRVLLPILRAVWVLTVAVYRFAARSLTPARAIAAVAAVALLALIGAQWLDLSSISVGTDAYAPGVESVAPAPEVSTRGTGDAHAWVMIPIALAGLAVLGAALAGRARAARLLAPAGIAVIVIALAVDAPKGLDEGSAAISYQGAAAHLLEGFWLQIACGAVLIACGLLLPGYLRADASGAAAAEGPGRARRGRPTRPSRPGGREWRLPGRPRKLRGQARLAADGPGDPASPSKDPGG